MKLGHHVCGRHLTFCAKDYATARELFKIGQYFDQQALTVFVLEGYASDHVTIALTDRVCDIVARRYKLFKSSLGYTRRWSSGRSIRVE